MVTAMGTAMGPTGRPDLRRGFRVVQAALRVAVCSVPLLLASTAAVGDGPRSNLGVRTVLNFTDNVLLTQANPESDVVLQVQPYFNSSWQGRVSSAQLAYGPQFAIYANHGDLNRTWQILQATGTTEVVKDFVSITATAQASPNIVNQGIATAGFDTVANPNAYTQTASFSIVPTFRFPLLRVGDYASVNFSPGLNVFASGSTAEGAGPAASSSFGSATSLSLTSGSYFYRMPWSLNYQGNLFDADTGAAYQQVGGQIGYRINARYRLDLLLGQDSQNVGSGFSNASTGRNLGDGIRWQPRLTWTPNAYTSAAIGIGHAPYGEDYYLNVRRQMSRFSLNLSYATTIQNARQAILNQQVIPFTDPFGDPILDPIGGGQLYQVVNTPTLIDETYVSDNLSALIAYRGRRTTVSFNATRDSNAYQFSDRSTVQSSGSLNMQYSLNAKLTARAVLLYRTYTYDPNVDLNYDQTRLELGGNYSLGRRARVGLAFYLSRSSAQSGQGTTANSGTRSTAQGQNGNFDEDRVVLTFSTEL